MGHQKPRQTLFPLSLSLRRSVTTVNQDHLYSNKTAERSKHNSSSWHNSHIKQAHAATIRWWSFHTSLDVLVGGKKPLLQVLPHWEHRGKFSNGAHCDDGKRLERQLGLFHSRGLTQVMHPSQFEVTYSATQFGGPTGMKDVVAHFKKLNGAKGWGEWEVDQVSTPCCTFFILFFGRLNI